MKNKWKKALSMVVLSAAVVTGLVGCGNGNGGEASADDKQLASAQIAVISREDGSGTRGAFIELFGVEQKNAAGEKEDMTTEEAIRHQQHLGHDAVRCWRCQRHWIYFLRLSE